MQSEAPDIEPESIESETTALVNVVAEGDPELMLAHVEKKAKVAKRYREAIETVMLEQTYPSDWNIQGHGDKAKACLSSAGAERIARSFPVSYEKVTAIKEEFEDSHGKAYRYVYQGYASLYDKTVFVQGAYSTRDKFLGYASGKWRAIEEINEGTIRSAAYHMFMGNAVKALLGLRGIPEVEYNRIMGKSGRDTSQTGSVTRGQGTQGGSSEDDHRHQVELGNICMEIANTGFTVSPEDDGGFTFVQLSDGDDRQPKEIASAICEVISGFDGKDGRVSGKSSPKHLMGKWLNASLGKARKLKEQMANDTD